MITKNIPASVTSGIPPKPHITGEGAVASLGMLEKVRYGPLLFTGYYRFPKTGRFRLYVGGGASFAIIFKEFNGSVEQLRVHNNWGSVLQGGAEYQLNSKYTLIIDFKEVWPAANAHGVLSDGAPSKGTRGTAIGSSDYHWFSSIGLARTYVFVRSNDEREILDALRSGPTVVYDQDGNAHGDPKLIIVKLLHGKPLMIGAGDHTYSGSGAIDVITRTCGWCGLVGLLLCGWKQRTRDCDYASADDPGTAQSRNVSAEMVCPG
jgi:hypothetical protein